VQIGIDREDVVSFLDKPERRCEPDDSRANHGDFRFLMRGDRRSP
jgi:hypothetical protein